MKGTPRLAGGKSEVNDTHVQEVGRPFASSYYLQQDFKAALAFLTGFFGANLFTML
jgi:hypothetical protein